MIYLAEVLIYTAIMFGAYLLLLKNGSAHRFNRLYLLACAVVPMVLPLIRLRVMPLAAQPAVLLPVLTIAAGAKSAISAPHFWDKLFDGQFYLIVAVLFALDLNNQYVRIRTVISMFRPLKVDGAKILCNTGIGPGSFGQYIFLPKGNDSELILEHELAHTRLRHSLDIVLIQVLQCIVWPNFILFSIIKELKMVHEFQADSYVAKGHDDYAAALLNETFQTKQFSLSHTFFYHPIKRRIMMLNTKTTGKAVYVVAVCLSVLLMGGLVWAQNAKPVKKTVVADAHGNKVYNIADKMPVPTFDIGTFMGENIQYPESARRDSIQGRVIVQFTVNTDGDVADLQVVKSPDTSLSRAAVQALSKMPKWTPGEDNGRKVNVRYTLPVMFSLTK